MDEVAVTPRPVDPFTEIIEERPMERFLDGLATARQCLGRRAIWHVNSTATGGGVAEMLQAVLCYPAALGLNVRRLVIDGNAEFFALTKRIHNLLHGRRQEEGSLDEADGSLGATERRLYESVLGREEQALRSLVRTGDVVVLHDPQVLGLAPFLTRCGAAVFWSCHVGADAASSATREAWEFLLPYVGDTVAQCFTRWQYRWEGLSESNVAVIPPCIDAFATKSLALEPGQVAAILDVSAIIPTHGRSEPPMFLRQDGNRGSITRQAEITEDEPPSGSAPLVCQISRWDPLKDHRGVMRAFVAGVPPELGAQLVLAGPASGSVDDDPEADETFQALVDDWERLPAQQRRHVHICALPMDDVEENAAMVNALQRRADVIVQKSLAEGFGLTVAEAMWKRRPTVGSRVGGIQDQIEHGRSGLLVDPTDSGDFASAVTTLLRDPAAAAKLGDAGRKRVAENYLAPSYLTAQFALILEVLDRRKAPAEMSTKLRPNEAPSR